MTHCYLMFVFLVASSILPADHALAYTAEEIFGGYPAYPANYKYHASIIGKINNTNILYLICAAGIISDYLLLSSAECVLTNGQLRKIKFFAVIDQVELTSKQILLRDIEEFYTYLYTYAKYKNNLVVIKLRESLEIEGTTFKSLEIASDDDIFHNRSGTVTGFGAESFDDASFLEGRGRVQLTEDPRELKYAFVEVATDFHCRTMFSYILRSTSFCGIIKVNSGFERRGICVGDIGTPFVIDNKVFGIASKHRPDCNDMINGSLYMKVSPYYSFIEGIKTGNNIPGTSVYSNNPHSNPDRD